MLIEGKNPIREALAAGTKISKLFIQKGLHGLDDVVSAAREAGARVILSDKRLMDRMSESGAHRGLIAEAAEFEYTSLEEIFERGKSGSRLILLLDGVSDPHNLGSIIRVAECAGADGVVIPARRSVPVNATVMRTSAGATAHIPVAQVGNLNDAIRYLKENFVRVIAADIGGVSMRDTDMRGDLAIVIGGEGDGVSALSKKLSDGVASIPQFGKINSLNASVATGIVVFEALRQRGEKC